MSRNKQIKVAKEAIVLLPDALEIEQERLPWYGRIGIIWIFLIVAAVLVWSYLGKVDIIVRTSGKIISDHGDIVMKPRESTVINSIEVKEGDIVKAGDILITFDPAVSQAEVDRLKHEVEALEAEFSRYDAEYNDREYSGGKGQDQDWQESIFKQRQLYYNQKLIFFQSNQNRLLAAKASVEQSYRKYCEILANMTKIEDMYASLYKKNVVPYKDLLEVTMSRMQNEAEVDRFRNQLVEYEHQLLSLEAEKNAFVEEWRNRISEKLVDISRELEGNRKQLTKAQSLMSFVSLRSPCPAVVHELAAFPVGSAVGEAEAVITLIPLDGLLEIEVEIRPQDISHVHKTSEARIKLSAFPFQKHGTLNGKVRLISGNTFTQQGSSGYHQQKSFYRAFVTISGKLRNIDQDFTLIPGMEAEVEIKSGRRRIIEYLSYPLIRGLDQAFTEP